MASPLFPPAMAGATGYPARQSVPGLGRHFHTPPAGYGEVAFHWWLGDPLTRERLEWQLDQLATHHVSGVQINYAHSAKGGLGYGLTYPSEPALFSEAWWQLFDWFLQAAGQRGMGVSLSDYTLISPGQGWFTDEILAGHPEMAGARLQSKRLNPAEALQWEVPGHLLSIVAIGHPAEALNGGASKRELTSLVHCVSAGMFCTAGALEAGQEQNAEIVAVWVEQVPASLDPMHPQSGAQLLEKFFGRFEARNPGQVGQALNFFFSDELSFGISGKLWNDSFAGEFIKRKGYDIVPEVAALFTDIGPRTPKIRMDYNDVMVQLEEDHFFQPVFEWHWSRGMLFGCDHGSRGMDVAEFGDYFRTQRWMPAPGCDQPDLASEVVRNKVASSIAHLYERPRTWLEGFYGSGWGTTAAQVTQAIFRNFAMGHNLLTLHGLYYSLHGGWWEWAPPCNHFRMPYWPHLRHVLACSERLSYVLSQGVHVCDVAVLYPVAPVEAGLEGKEAVETAFRFGDALYKSGLDFDFIDFQSVERAQVEGERLCVSGERYQVLVLPHMRAVRHGMLQQALNFARQGGIVLSIGALPEVSDRLGRSDEELIGIVEELFAPDRESGLGVAVATVDEALTWIRQHLHPDFALLEPQSAFEAADACIEGQGGAEFQLRRQPPGATESVAFQHRRIDDSDLYLVHGAPRGTRCYFRTGPANRSIELWDPWTGLSRPLAALEVLPEGVVLELPLDATDAQIIVFGAPTEVLSVRTRQPELAPLAIPLNETWDMELVPTMDNRWGDFRRPAFADYIAAETRRLRWRRGDDAAYADVALEDSDWATATCSFGPQLFKLGPFPADADSGEFEALENELRALTSVDTRCPVPWQGREYNWQPYEFSWQQGREGDPGLQGYHGLKGLVTGEFLVTGSRELPARGQYWERFEPEGDGDRYYFWGCVQTPEKTNAVIEQSGLLPVRVWVNGQPCEGREVVLEPGANPFVLRYDGLGRGSFVLLRQEANNEALPSGAAVAGAAPAMPWYGRSDVLPFDAFPEDQEQVSWYRCQTPPGALSCRVWVRGQLEAWIGGQPATVDLVEVADGVHCYAVSPAPAVDCRVEQLLALRLEGERTFYGGAAFAGPIRYSCGNGEIQTGDWSQLEGLATYSGGMRYRQNVLLPEGPRPARAVLELSDVAGTAEVWINGHPAGVRVQAPWRWDVSQWIAGGENQCEVLVYNTLANHYSTIPTEYCGSAHSGIIGPVQLEVVW